MYRITVTTLALVLTLGVTAAAAQECKILCTPVFAAQPGVVISNAINAPTVDAAGNAGESSAEFLFRVVTVVPTQAPRVALVGVVQWTPFASEEIVVGTTRSTATQNAPTFVYGPVFTVFNKGPVGVTFNVLGAYGPDGTLRPTNRRSAYKHQLVLEADAVVNVGASLGASAPPLLRDISVYAFVAQQMSDRPVDFGGNSVYAPAMLLGLSVPLAAAR
jgi:hypothetical protein